MNEWAEWSNWAEKSTVYAVRYSLCVCLCVVFIEEIVSSFILHPPLWRRFFCMRALNPYSRIPSLRTVSEMSECHRMGGEMERKHPHKNNSHSFFAGCAVKTSLQHRARDHRSRREWDRERRMGKRSKKSYAWKQEYEISFAGILSASDLFFFCLFPAHLIPKPQQGHLSPVGGSESWLLYPLIYVPFPFFRFVTPRV